MSLRVPYESFISRKNLRSRSSAPDRYNCTNREYKQNTAREYKLLTLG